MLRIIRPSLAIFFAGFASAPCGLAQTAVPPSKPFLRIETGMHTAAIRAISADAAGRFVVTASDDKTARVWDARSGDLLRVLRPPQGDGNNGKLFSLAISPDGATVAVGGHGFSGQQSAIYLFDRAKGEIAKHVDVLPVEAVLHLDYSPDGRYLAAALERTGIRIYRSNDMLEIARDTDYGANTYSVEFDRAGRLVTACYDGVLRVYDAKFRLVAKRQVPGGKRPQSARFSPDGGKVAVVFMDSTSVNVLSGQDLTFLYASDTNRLKNGGLFSVAWSLDGQFLFAGGRFAGSGMEAFPVLRWSNAGRGTLSIVPAANNSIISLRALTRGQLLFASFQPDIGMLDSDGRIVWQQTPEILDHGGNQDKLRLSRDGSIVEFGYLVHSPQSGWITKLSRFSIADRKLQIDPAPDHSLRPPRTDGLNIAEWNGKEHPTLNGRSLSLEDGEECESLAVSANADTFLLGTSFYLRLFDRTGRALWAQDLPAIALNVNLTSDRKHAVAALGDGTIRWYSIEDGKEVLALFVHPDGRRWVCWTPEGFFDASPGGENLIGYHLNQGWDRAGEFIRVDQVFNVFYRSDLVSTRLKAGGAEAVRAARDRIGDVASIIAGGLPPKLALVSPAESQSQGDFLFQFRVNDAGGGIGRVVYRIDGVEIQGRDAGIPLPGQGMQNRRFSLGSGTHEVSAIVYNGKNQVSRSIAAKVTVTAVEQAPALHVVAAGVTNYRDQTFNEGVKFAKADAAALVDRLKVQGAGLFSKVNAYTLYDDKATRDNLGKTIAEAATHIQPGDVFVLYLAGHGTAIDGRYYFIPWEVRYTSEAALKQQSLDEDALRELLRKIPAKKTLLILDTCSAGAFRQGRGPQEKAAVDRLAKITGRAILAAAASDKMALEGFEGHSVLMASMLEALSKVADSKGDVQVSAFADFVVDQVPTITKKRWNYEQFPMWIFEGQTFPIARRPRP